MHDKDGTNGGKGKKLIREACAIYGGKEPCRIGE